MNLKRKEKSKPAQARPQGEFKALFTSLKGRNGLFAAVSILVVLAIVIIVNLAVGLLPASLLQKDLSSEKIYTVSDTSQELLSGLDTDVEIIVLAPTDGVDQRISTYLDLYCSLSDHLSLKTIDTTLYPSALSEYDTESSSVVVVRNADTGKQQIISFDDILVYDLYTYYYYGQLSYTEFDAESQLTSAINLVTSDAAHTVYCDTGHGEAALGSEVSDQIEKNNLTTQDVNLLTDGGIPEGCELLLFNQPTSDLSADELTQVEEFLSGGGHVMVLLSSETAAASFPNLNSLTNSYGLNILEGSLADQANYYQYFGSAYVFFPSLSSSDSITSALSSDSYVMVGYDGTNQVSPAIPLEVVDPSIDGVTVTSFLTTSDSGVAYVSQDNYATGSYVVGAYATDENTGARLTVISADSFVDDALVSSFTGVANVEVFMNAMTAGFDDMETISIESKSLEVTPNTVRNPALWTLIFVIILPVVILLGGFLHWLRRRKL